MSNNKQSSNHVPDVGKKVKLYTEEQIRQSMDFARGHHRMSDTQFIDSITPIELPSDEEIEKQSLKIDIEYTFCDGAKWMRDKIQGGNNEQR